ncbi:MAG: hypothetical protein ACWGQW_01240 [bacterium]
MTRREVKYLLARLRAHAESGAVLPELPEGFAASFEKQEGFRGWVNYHVTWDVDDEDVWRVVSRDKSQEEEWHEEILPKLPIITPDGIERP